MKIAAITEKHRSIITISLALVAIGLMLYYDYCNTSCRYIEGDILGIDLKWIGIFFMAAIIAFVVSKQNDFVRFLLAAGLGAEVFLISFQIRNNVYCPFCMVFAGIVIAAFIINYRPSPAWLENQLKMWTYFMGEVNFPMFKIKRLPLVVVALIGYFFVFFTFAGSVTPAYGQDRITAIPSLGKGDYEVIMFADYFCPPCRRIDIKAEPLFKELLETGKVKITFVDVPFSRPTPTYAKYYLYAVNANPSADNVFHVRKTLFDAAQIKHIQREEDLVNYLKEQKVKWKKMDEKSIFPLKVAVINKHEIRATPTCVIKYSAKDIKKYVGDDKIWDGLMELKEHLQRQAKRE